MLVCLHVPLRLLLRYFQVLQVAILMRNQAAVQALLESGFSSMCRNSRRWTALDEAISTRHHGITKLLYMHAYAYKKQRMKEKKAQLLTTCNELPNYSVKVCFNQGVAVLGWLLHSIVLTLDVVGHFLVKAAVTPYVNNLWGSVRCPTPAGSIGSHIPLFLGPSTITLVAHCITITRL